MAQDRKPSEKSKETGSARVYAQLRKEILRLELAPGAPLDEVTLSERFKLSRSPIREALVRLAGEGFVKILPNRSTIVSTLDFRSVPRYLDALDLLQRVTTRLAAQFRSDDDLRGIEGAQQNFEKAFHQSLKTKDSSFNIEANFQFHMRVAEAGQNEYLTNFYRRILDEGRRMLHFHFEFQALTEKMSFDEVSIHHVQMIEAIRDRDLDRAEEVAHQHAMQFKGRFLDYFTNTVTSEVSVKTPGELV